MGPLIAVAQTLRLTSGGAAFTATVIEDGRVRVGDREVAVTAYPDRSLRFDTAPGVGAWTASAGDTRWVFLDGRVYEFDVARGHPGRRRTGGHHGSLTAPMPATVLRINVAPGDRVNRGDALIILEAMKMELPIKAAAAGSVVAVHCREGELVQPGAPLVELDDAV